MTLKKKKDQPHFDRSSSGHYSVHKNAILIILIFKRLSGHPNIAACFSLDEYIYFMNTPLNITPKWIIYNQENCMAGVWSKKKETICGKYIA